MIDLLLFGATVTLAITNYISYNVTKKNKSLLKERELLTEYAVDSYYSGNTSSDNHDWSKDIITETVYTSKSPISFERVVVGVTKCHRCQMVHRYIIDGLVLANKKGLLELEGFYLNGKKVLDQGCKISASLIEDSSEIGNLEDD